MIQKIKKNSPLFFILGPCVIESEKHSLKVAEYLKNLSNKLGFTLIFKSSFDKANRTSIDSYRGVGIKEGARILNKVKSEFNIPIITDLHIPSQAQEVASFADVIQIPAFLCRQTDLLIAAGKTGKTINVKKGQFVAASTMKKVAAKIASTGNDNIWICERGYAFGYGDLIVDFRNFTEMKKFNYPIVFDATHSVQKPSTLGSCSDGDRKYIADLAIAAVSTGIEGIFMEVHDDPDNALCDGPNSVRLSQLEELIKYLMDLDAWIKEKKRPTIF